LADAQTQARETLEQARRAARDETEKILTEAEAAAQSEKSAQLTRAAAEIHAAIRLDETIRQAAATAGLRAVCGGQQEARP
jgi:vacuolar-type H+-ATPase subunit H